ncbi:MAG: hypothetical protein ACFBQW_03860 [Sphingomonadaceae bacterium]
MQWWDRAAEILTAPDMKLRRFGFVTTNSITQEFSRRVIARHLSSPSPDGEGDHPKDGGGVGPPAQEDPSTSKAGPPPRQAGEDLGLSLVMAIPDHPWTRTTKDAAAVRIAMTVAESGAHDGALLEVEHEGALDSDEPEIRYAESLATGRINWLRPDYQEPRFGK